MKLGKVDYKNGYTPYSWQGVNYESGLSTKDIAKLIRKELKILYPHNKYSITTEYNHIYVSLMQSNISPFMTKDQINFELIYHRYEGTYTKEEVDKYLYNEVIEQGYMQINHFHIDTSWRMTKETKEMFAKIKNMLDSFNFDDSDIQTDYFHSNYYIDLAIGRWDKALIITQ